MTNILMLITSQLTVYNVKDVSSSDEPTESEQVPLQFPLVK